MSFHRTPGGLFNLRYFLKVDGVIYVEGGESFTAEQIMNGSYTAESHDIHFWRTVFRACGSSLKLAFRAVGSKTNLQKLARLVDNGEVTGTLVAMDRDYDHLFGNKISSPQVLYTYGYSWENDVWTTAIIEELFYCVTGSDLERTKVNGD